MTQLQADNARITISAVAKVAGITPALIHNTYPDLAEQIRGLSGKATRAQRDAKHNALMKEREANKALRVENIVLKGDVARLASVNQTLLAEMAVLKGIASGKVVELLRGNGADLVSLPAAGSGLSATDYAENTPERVPVVWE